MIKNFTLTFLSLSNRITNMDKCSFIPVRRHLVIEIAEMDAFIPQDGWFSGLLGLRHDSIFK